MVANRVCTTDSSSAQSSTATASAAAMTGVPGSAVSATVATLPRSSPRSSSTSVVVPDRVIATTRSYGRPAGNSEEGYASVSPCPAASRSAAYAMAMNQEVPHPVTATRSPGRGSPSNVAAASAARRQQPGWVAISDAVRDMLDGSLRCGT